MPSYTFEEGFRDKQIITTQSFSMSPPLTIRLCLAASFTTITDPLNRPVLQSMSQ